MTQRSVTPHNCIWPLACPLCLFEENARLRARLERLQAALQKYGVHTYACASNGTTKNPLHAFVITNPGPCDCGLVAEWAGVLEGPDTAQTTAQSETER